MAKSKIVEIIQLIDTVVDKTLEICKHHIKTITEINEASISNNDMSEAIKGIEEVCEILCRTLIEVRTLLKSYLKREHEIYLTDNCDFFKLTLREREVLKYIVVGKTNMEMADLLNVSDKTISSHVRNMFDKVDARNRMELIYKLRYHTEGNEIIE